MQQFAFSPNCSFLLINLLVIGITLQLTYHIFEHTPTEKPGTLIVHWPFLLSPLGQWEALSFEIPAGKCFYSDSTTTNFSNTMSRLVFSDMASGYSLARSLHKLLSFSFG